MSSLFSLDNILLNEEYYAPSMVKLSNIPIVQTLESYSPIEEGYSFILEMQGMCIAAEKKFIVSVMESSGDIIAINESMSEFFAKVKEMISKAIQWIKDTVSKLIAKIKKFFNSESKDNASYRDKLKKKIDQFKDKNEFDISGYKYTLNAIDANIEKAGTPTILKQMIDLVSCTNYDKQRGELKSKIDDVYESLKHDREEHVSNYRKAIIGKSNGDSMSQSDFSEELFKIFRDGSKDKITITVNKTYLQTIYDEYFSDSFMKLSSDIKHDSITELEKFSSTLKYEMSTEVEDDDIANKVNSIRKSCCALIQEFCDIIIHVVSAKSQAIKECIEQYDMTFKKLTNTVSNSDKSSNDK